MTLGVTAITVSGAYAGANLAVDTDAKKVTLLSHWSTDMILTCARNAELFWRLAQLSRSRRSSCVKRSLCRREGIWRRSSTRS